MGQTTLRRIMAGSSSLALMASLTATATLAIGVSSSLAQEAANAPVSTARQTPAPNVVGTDIEEVVVTARLREESIQEVPEQIVAITPEVLKAGNITSFYDLQGFAPSVSMSAGWNKNISALIVRGYTAAQYVNEVPASPSSLYDLSGVQILYGPQGTLFGYVALGGAVLYTPAHPDLNEFGAGVDLTFGNLNTTNIQAHVNIPIIQDQLGLRIAYSRNHTDGYTRIENNDTLLDSVDNEGLRIGLEWRPGDGRFKTYTVAQFDKIRDTAPPEIVTAYNPLDIAYQESGTTPGGYRKPGPLAPNYFINAGLCTPALLATVWPAGTTAEQCNAQRFNLLNTFRQQTMHAMDLARNSDYRVVPQPMVDGPLDVPSDDYQLQNISDFEVGTWDGFLGGGELRLHNVVQARWARNYVTNFTVGAFDYYTYRLTNSAATGAVIPTPNVIITDSANPPRNSFGEPGLGKLNFDWGNEFQIHGTLGENLGATPAFTWVLGFYGHWTKGDAASTPPNVPVSYLGAFTPNEGPVPSFWTAGSDVTNFGQYFNATLDFGAFSETLKGLQFTGGVRYNQNRFENSYFTFNRDYTRPGIFYPSPPLINTLAESKPVNWSWSLNYITGNNTLYATSSYIVVPGFANTPLPAPLTEADVPGFVAFAEDEQLTSYEIGNKWTFDINGMRGYFNVAIYRQQKENVQVGQTLFIPSLARYITFSSNPATEVKQGIELQGEIQPNQNLQIYANLSYSDQHYTKYLRTDPYLIDRQYSIAPGAVNSPYCVPSESLKTIAAGATVGSCIMDFKDSAMRFNSEWQASIRVNYTIPLGDELGDLILGGTANYLSDAYIGGGYTNVPLLRHIQVQGPQIEEAMSQKAYTLVNLRLTWDRPMGHDNYSAAFYVTNATDVTYSFGALDFLTATGVTTKSFGPPRKFGISLSAKW